MKKVYILLTLAVVTAAVSCNRKQKELSEEEIRAKKTILAEDMLGKIDSLAEVSSRFGKTGGVLGFELTAEEKVVKPDFLINPYLASFLVSKEQKVNALGILMIDNLIRKKYEMPTAASEAAIIKLASELDHPFDKNIVKSTEMQFSEKIKLLYDYCKERGDQSYFWQLVNVEIIEIQYIVAQNPELFFSKISEKQWGSFVESRKARTRAIKELAKYDEETAKLWDDITRYEITLPEGNRGETRAEAIQLVIDNRKQIIELRNNLLK